MKFIFNILLYFNRFIKIEYFLLLWNTFWEWNSAWVGRNLVLMHECSEDWQILTQKQFEIWIQSRENVWNWFDPIYLYDFVWVILLKGFHQGVETSLWNQSLDHSLTSIGKSYSYLDSHLDTNIFKIQWCCKD